MGVMLIGLCLTWPQDLKAQEVLAHGRRVRGPEMPTGYEFNKKRGHQYGIGWKLGNPMTLIERFYYKPPLNDVLMIPEDDLAKHFLLIGDTGSGKSALIRQILDQLDRYGDTAIVYDPAQEYVKLFYRPERGNVILNPLDERWPYWPVGEEIEHEAEAGQHPRTGEQLIRHTRGSVTPRRSFIRTRCFFNVTETSDGKAHSVQPQELYRTQQYATAVYQSELASKLRGMGYEIEAGKTGAPEIKGFTQEYAEAMSPRRRQIEEHLDAQGKHGAAAAQIAAHRTRDAKEPLSEEETLRRHREMAAKYGNQPAQVIEAAKERTIEPRGHARPAQSAMTFARDRNMEREAVVDERAMMRDALKRSMGQATFAEVKAHFNERIERGEFVEVTAKIGRNVTTPEMIALERSNIERMKEGQGRYEALAEPRWNDRLSVSQNQAVQQVLESRDQVTGLQGAAGAGKTTSLAALREAVEPAGCTVEGFAPTSRAAYQLEEAGVKATTVQHHLVKSASNGNGAKHLYIVDE